MKRNKIYTAGMLAAALILSMAFTACGSKANPAKDFRWKVDETGVTITDYVGESKTVVIPAKLDGKPVTVIAGVFGKGLNITIPSSVTSLGAGVNGILGDDPPTAITVDKGNQTYTSANGVLYSKDRKTLLLYPQGDKNPSIPDFVTTIGESSFSRYSGMKLTSVVIPNSVTKIANYAFRWNELTAVTLPDSVTEIGQQAFAGNPLTSVTIGANVKFAGYYIFGDDDEEFEAAYENGGKQAGTYTRPNTDSTAWKRQ
jgi:hypothetical protein